MVRRLLLALVTAVASAACVHADTVYFVSKMTGGLYSFQTSGTSISTIAAPGTFSSPSALAMGSDGNLYIGDATDGGRIARYVLSSGSVSSVVTLNGAGPSFSGAPVNPGAIAFTPGGAMLVGRNPEVAFFPGGTATWPGGTVLSVTGWRAGDVPAISGYTAGTSQDYSPGLAVAVDGTLYASNSFYNATTGAMTGNVLKFNSSGTYQAEVTADGSASSGLFGPAGLTLAGNSLFIASTINGNIYRTDLTNPDTSTNTVLFASTEGGGDYIGPLSALSNGGLLTGGVANSGFIYHFDPTGILVGTFGDSSYGAIGGIVAVPEPSAAVLAIAGVSLAGFWLIRRRKA